MHRCLQVEILPKLYPLVSRLQQSHHFVSDAVAFAAAFVVPAKAGDGQQTASSLPVSGKYRCIAAAVGAAFVPPPPPLKNQNRYIVAVDIPSPAAAAFAAAAVVKLPHPAEWNRYRCTFAVPDVSAFAAALVPIWMKAIPVSLQIDSAPSRN